MGFTRLWTRIRVALASILLVACATTGVEDTSTVDTVATTTRVPSPGASTTTSEATATTSETVPPGSTTPRRELGDALVWFGPNMGSVDLLELFSDPDSWSEAREKIDVFQFFSGNLFAEPCEICGDNSLPALAGVEAFRLLDEWGVAIAIEVGAVYEGGCQGEINFGRDAGVVISSVQRQGGKVSFVAMDEPLLHSSDKPVSGACGYIPKEAATEAADFAAAVTSAYPEIVVGDIEPYPHYSVAELEDWIVALEEAGFVPGFFHLDVDTERVRTHGHDVASDLAALKAFVEERGIVFGVILTSNWTQSGNDTDYFASTLEWVQVVKEAIGRPSDVIFESWQGPAASGHHEVPTNLPGDGQEDFSHTRLVIAGLRLLDG